MRTPFKLWYTAESLWNVVGLCLLPVKLFVCFQSVSGAIGIVTEKLSQAQLGCPAGELRRLDGPTALKGFQHLQAHALSSTSPGADQIAELATYQGMLAACIWADPAAKWQWRQGDVEHATLMLHALLERPMPAAEVATDDGVMLRIQLSTSTM